MTVPIKFKPVINTVYPSSNKIEFERWVSENFNGCKTDREYLDVYWTAYFVNNNYGNDKKALDELQEFINQLDKSKKYWTLCQYDDSILVDVSGIDLLRFEMSRKGYFDIPLIGQPYPYTFDLTKKYLFSFVGSMTHPIRQKIKELEGYPDSYISFDPHPPEKYCEILSRSIFALAPRGYGINSFRIAEAVQYGAIPVYYSDIFCIRNDCFFSEFGVLIHQSQNLLEEIKLITEQQIHQKQKVLQSAFDKYFSYQSVYNFIINTLETECH